MVSPSRGRGFRCKINQRETTPPTGESIINILRTEPKLLTMQSDFEVNVYQPTQTPNYFHSLSSNAPLSLKQKFGKGIFQSVDTYDNWLSSTKIIQNQKERLNKKDSCVLFNKSQIYLLTSIDGHLSSFFVFKLAARKILNLPQDLLKYMSVIRHAPTRFPDWFKYDEQFQLRMANNRDVS